jgi:hypothetical protein
MRPVGTLPGMGDKGEGWRGKFNYDRFWELL